MSSNTANLPVMVYDWNDKRIREIAENIWHAQKAGWPDVLTYVYRGDNDIRRLSLRGIPRIQSRDEYPFASTLENEGSVWVGHASVAQQTVQRDLMNSFYRSNGAYRKGATFRFRVSVINYPVPT
ncbi:hypothetical protein BN2476_490064 [Paraburkholderia piptadeniae]|uniref:Uncharacterized protein n=1 Tax=Paraburkholderia piptadeniae TaxID=1701573 RepID=A0A1N7SEW9_9BURK|nr:hypothetical protein [Paraburkholderia piptadeniae]SIT45936.1 hypothetical protein BN2476_490064 [Paraburkholderia piptadeniae]